MRPEVETTAGRKALRTSSAARVAGPILVNLLLGPVREHLIDVRMTQGPIQRRVSSVAMEVMNPGNINVCPHSFLVFVFAADVRRNRAGHGLLFFDRTHRNS